MHSFSNLVILFEKIIIAKQRIVFRKQTNFDVVKLHHITCYSKHGHNHPRQILSCAQYFT